MGCDIHTRFEIKQEDGSWESSEEWDRIKDDWRAMSANAFSDRHYAVFEMLTGGEVRGRVDYFQSTIAPRGTPDDCSDDVRADIDAWGCDGHSHSYLTLEECLHMQRGILREVVGTVGIDEPKFYTDIMDSIIDGFPNHEGPPDSIRAVFWFDN